MNPGQEMFYKFFMERVQEDKKEEADALLKKGFELQEQGAFDRAYLMETMPKYMELIQPDALDEVKEAMAHFASRL